MKHLVRSHDPRLTTEEAEQICRVTILFNLVAIAFLGLFSLIAASTGERGYVLVLLGVMTLALANIVCFSCLAAHATTGADHLPGLRLGCISSGLLIASDLLLMQRITLPFSMPSIHRSSRCFFFPP